jgi:hypothetical protein
MLYYLLSDMLAQMEPPEMPWHIEYIPMTEIYMKK